MGKRYATIEDRVHRRNLDLTAVAEAAADYFNGSRKPTNTADALRNAVKEIRAALREIQDSYGVIIGGLAVQELGYARFTKDVDVIVDAAHYRKILQYLREHGFELTVDSILVHRQNGAEIDLLKEGAKLKDSKLPLPHPSELGPNAGFASLPGLLRLKLDAGRMQDQADIVKLLIPRLDLAPELSKQLPAILRPKFKKLLAQARKEAR
jgi:hypothetical protein